MSEVTVTAIVLRRRDSGENDRRLTLLAKELGKVDVIAKGARKGNSRLSGSSDPLAMSTMTLAKGKVNLFITQAQPLSSFRGLRTDFERLSMALALVELYAYVLPWGEPMDNAFELLGKSLRAIESHPKPIVALVWAELKLMAESGYLPPFDTCIATGESVQEALPWLSPTAGGYVKHPEVMVYRDAFESRAEVLWGLAKTVELESPPTNLKFAGECLTALIPFWRHIIDAPLVANEAVKKELRHSHL